MFTEDNKIVFIAVAITIIMVLVVVWLACYHGDVAPNFVKVKTFYSSGVKVEYAQTLVYDKDTKVMYIILSRGNKVGITPYYVLIENEPVVAVYGVNYPETN